MDVELRIDRTEPERGRVLLPLARAALAQALGRTGHADESAHWLDEHGACFVTLTRQGELRGCIGTLHAWRPLRDDVKHNAVAAALRDPRFLPLRADELDCIEVEVSLLSPPEALTHRDEAEALARLRPGVDGVLLEYRQHRSTYLPQVWEVFPQPRQFLRSLKRKAGLPEDFWAEELRLARYTVEKWRESDYAENEA